MIFQQIQFEDLTDPQPFHATINSIKLYRYTFLQSEPNFHALEFTIKDRQIVADWSVKTIKLFSEKSTISNVNYFNRNEAYLFIKGK